MDKTIIENNRKAWNTATQYHNAGHDGALHKGFADPNYTRFDDDKVKFIKDLDLAGKVVAHVQTNNGRELISLMRASTAKEGVGFDISDDAIKVARELGAIAKVNARFERVNIFEIPEKYNGYFDFVYITEGSLSWLPCMDEYFKVMARLLKPGGKILIQEIHPVAFILHGTSGERVNYTDKGPHKMIHSLDYVGSIDYSPTDCNWFMHTMADIWNALAKHDFEITQFTESTEDTGWMDAQDKMPNFPRSFVMLCAKRS